MPNWDIFVVLYLLLPLTLNRYFRSTTGTTNTLLVPRLDNVVQELFTNTNFILKQVCKYFVIVLLILTAKMFNILFNNRSVFYSDRNYGRLPSVHFVVCYRQCYPDMGDDCGKYFSMFYLFIIFLLDIIDADIISTCIKSPLFIFELNSTLVYKLNSKDLQL